MNTVPNLPERLRPVVAYVGSVLGGHEITTGRFNATTGYAVRRYLHDLDETTQFHVRNNLDDTLGLEKVEGLAHTYLRRGDVELSDRARKDVDALGAFLTYMETRVLELLAGARDYVSYNAAFDHALELSGQRKHARAGVVIPLRTDLMNSLEIEPGPTYADVHVIDALAKAQSR